jgi:hypothetical protein
MVENVALITSLFDYPSNYNPIFFNNALKYFDEKNIHIIRNNGLIKDGSYYDKLFFYKIPKVLEYLKEKILGNYDYVLFLDATDTNFYSSPKDIINLFLSKNCSIIFGAEKGLWPNTSYTHLYESKNINSEYKYLNSGTYFGFTEKIVNHMETIIDKGYENGIDDQGKWTIEYLLSDDITIDYNCEFFMSSFESKNYFEVKNNEVKILSYNPMIIHDNGPHNDNTIKVTNLL